MEIWLPFDISAKSFKPNTLKESTIRGWKTKYLNAMGKRKERGCKDIEVKVLPSAKIGRPLLVG